MGIGVKASIEHCLTSIKKLDKKRKKVFEKGFLYDLGINNKVCVLIRPISSAYDVEIITYFKNLIIEVGLDKFLNMNDELVSDSFRETKYTYTKDIIWAVKEKYIKFFKEISNDFLKNI